MARPAVLFATRNRPSLTEKLTVEGGNITGLAEWLESLPDLFLLLLGKTSEAVPFTILDESPAQAALASPLESARQRLRAFAQLAQPHLARAALAQLRQIGQTLEDCNLPWLLLDVIEQAPVAPDDPAYAAFLQRLAERANELEQALDLAAQTHPAGMTIPDALQPLLYDWQRQWGWWSTATSARTHLLEPDDQRDRALFARENLQPVDPYDVMSRRTRFDEAWMDGVGAYLVRTVTPGGRKHGSAPAPAVGLITPHGRWILPLQAGVNRISACDVAPGLLCCIRDTSEDDSECGLIDTNGVWLYPFGSFHYLNPITPQLMVCQTWEQQESHPDLFSLCRISDGSVLHDNLSDARLDEDGLLRLVDTEQRMALADAEDARIRVPYRYADIHHVHPAKHWAVMRDEQGKEGILGLERGEIIPCRHEFFARGNRDLPPRVFRRDRWVAVDYADGMQLTVYSIDGLRIAGPMKTASNDIPPLVENDLLLVLEGNGDADSDPLVAWMDFDGNIVKHTDRTWPEMLGDIWERRRARSADARRFNHAKWLKQLVQCLRPDDAQAARELLRDLQAGVKQMQDDMREDGHQAEPRMIAQAALSTAPTHLQFDWKEDSLLRTLQASLPDLHETLEGFHWDPNDNGDSIADGIAAAREFLSSRGHRLFEIPTDADAYALIVVPQAQADQLVRLCEQAGLPLD